MVNVWLPYGKTEVCARIPTRSFLGAIEPRERPGVPDQAVEVRRALREPIGTKTVSEMIKPGDRVAIVVDDATRLTPSHLLVSPLLEELNNSGVKDEDVTVIFACGARRAVTQEEAIALLGEAIVKKVRVVSHDCLAKDLVYVGTTKTHGTRVHVNRVFAEADVRILTGNIELHCFAGYDGGRRSVLPGVSGYETIRKNHVRMLHPKARAGTLEGNPVHEDVMEAARLAKVDFILNVVTNTKGEIVRAFAGDVEQAFYEGVKLVDEMYKIPVERRANIVLVSPGGDPLDKSLYMAYRAIDNALGVMKRGGVIICVAECPGGHGNEVFYDWMKRYGDLREVEKAIKRRFKPGGEAAYFLLKALQKAKIILVSSMPDYYAVNVFKLKTARAVNDALREAFGIAGANARVWAIPHGSLTLPTLKVGD